MIKRLLFSALGLFLYSFSFAQDFTQLPLLSTTGDSVRLADFKDQKVVVLIFSGVHCVYSKKYEARIMATAEAHANDSVAFLMINSNDPDLSPEDSYEGMVEQVTTKGFSFPYLADPDQSLANAIGAKKNPEAFVFVPLPNEKFQLVYHGAIDDNPLLADRVHQNFLGDAIQHGLSGKVELLPAQPVKGCYLKSM